MRGLFLDLLAVLALAGYSRSTPSTTATTSSASIPLATPNPSSSASASAATAGPVTYTGHYTSKEGSLFVPDGAEWSGVKWRGDDASIGMGDGTLTFTVDPKTGRLDGTGDGAIGPVVVTGMLSDARVSFTLARKDISDEGFTGSAIGRVTDGKILGTMNLSLASASVIREASFSLTRK